MRVPDSPENRAHFGSGKAGGGRGNGGYPLARVVTLMVLRTHLFLGARLARYRTSERSMARELWGEVPDDSL